jgi:hypothetical protein
MLVNPRSARSSADPHPNRFFILTQSQVNEGIETDWNAAVARRKAKCRNGLPADVTGVTWKFAESHESNWETLPQ